MAEPIAKVALNYQFLKNWQNFSKANKHETIGFLHGFESQSCVHLLSCSVTPEGKATALQDTYSTISGCLPAGIAIVGILVNGPSTLLGKLKQDALNETKDLFERDSFLVCLPDDGDKELPYIQEYQADVDEFVNVDLIQTDRLILDDCVKFRVQGAMKFGVDYTNHKDNLSKAILAEIQFLQDQVESEVTAYHVVDSDVVIPWGVQDAETMTCRDIFSHIRKADEDEFDHKKRMKSKDLSQEWLNIRLLQKISRDKQRDNSIGCAPIIHHKHEMFQYLKVELPVDVVGYAEQRTLTSDLCDDISRAISRQLYAMYKCMLSTLQSGIVKCPRPFHFCPDSRCHLFTVVYPKGVDEEDLRSTRQRLHRTLLLAEDRPQVRRMNSHRFPGETVSGGYLLNTHIGLPPSGVPNGQPSLVQGTYAYHHYMQDHFDDNGWGCAYRSLQTLVSWFRFQGYTTKPVPSHRLIQQTLVDIGDKEAKLVGSKQWIGSTEVGYVLDQLLGVTSKIMFVSSGAELNTKGRELAMHFDSQGSPVMIGGGNKAHTILGVDFDEVTGDVKFLVLDPHYTGGEDLKTIQDKGWCGWKSPDFWDKNSFCNLCLPQRPVEI